MLIKNRDRRNENFVIMPDGVATDEPKHEYTSLNEPTYNFLMIKEFYSKRIRFQI